MKTMKQFIEHSHIDGKLIRATVRKLGGWEDFTECAQDITEHGADAGFGQFVYYKDTCEFYAKNRAAIVGLANNIAIECSEDLTAMVRGFRCLGMEYSGEEVGQTLYGPKNKHQTQVANALAWLALEEVARSYVDFLESEEG